MIHAVLELRFGSEYKVDGYSTDQARARRNNDHPSPSHKK